MRELQGHKVNPANDSLRVLVVDRPGAGGAHHLYAITGFDMERNPLAMEPVPEGLSELGNGTAMPILFQNGPIAEVGVNGVTHEALLAVLIDRLECFQAGPYNCLENETALAHLRDAQAALQARTKARMARGVEGTHTV